MNWKGALCVCIAICGGLWGQDPLPTYFSYDAEQVDELKALHSSLTITPDQLRIEDEKVAALKLDYLDETRLYTYLYASQRDAAFLSYSVHGRFEGSLEPLSDAIRALFVKAKRASGDPYSEKLCAIVFSKFQERFEKENASPFYFRMPARFLERKETSYLLGEKVATWMPWIAKPSIKYYPPLPPAAYSAKWDEQIAAIKKAQAPLTPQERQRIDFWAGKTGTGSGDWRSIANAYMFNQKIPLAQMLLVRATLMMGIYDTSIVYYGAKYRYHIVRPQVRDRTITYLIDVPNHPSYPSGHSSLAGVASTILSCYFPQNRTQWAALAKESGLSRIWAGIHYPLDDEEGFALGQKVAQAVIAQGCF